MTLTNRVDETTGVTTTVPTAISTTAPAVPTSPKGLIQHGYLGVVISNIDIMDYASDTYTPQMCGTNVFHTTTIQLTHAAAGNSSSTKGYIVGGVNSTFIEAYRWDNYSAVNVVSVLPHELYDAASFYSPTKGYTICGQDQVVNTYNVISSLTYSNDTYASTGQVITPASALVCGFNSSLYGYAFGGSAAGADVKIAKYNFSTNAIVVLGATVEQGDSRMKSMIDNNYAIIVSVESQRDQVMRFDFATDTIGLTSSKLITRHRAGSTMSSATNGYLAAGLANSATYVDTTEKVPFSTMTFGVISAKTSTKSQSGCGATSVVQGAMTSYVTPVVPTAQRGYLFGGRDVNGALLNTIVYFDFVTYASSTLTSMLQVGKCVMYGCNSSTKGYVAGGYFTNHLKSTDGLRFDTETSYRISSNFTAGKSDNCSNASATKGYWFGGYIDAGISLQIDRLTFSTEVFAVLAAVIKATSRQYSSNVASNLNSYVCGGNTTGQSIEKFTFPTEANNTSASTLTYGTYFAASLENLGVGYILGGTSNGTTGQSNVNKLQFVNDAVVAVAAALSSIKFNLNGISQATHGYTVGNKFGSQIVEGFDYSTEAYSLCGVTLNIASYQGASISNYTFKS
jgi:hypothetical protein